MVLLNLVFASKVWCSSAVWVAAQPINVDTAQAITVYWIAVLSPTLVTLIIIPLSIVVISSLYFY